MSEEQPGLYPAGAGAQRRRTYQRQPDRNEYTSEQIRELYAGPARVAPADEVIDHQVKLRADMTHPLMLARLRALMEYITNDAVAEADATHQDRVHVVNSALSGLFWPAKDQRELAGLFSRELFAARTYQVTGEMVDAVSATYKQSQGLVGHLEEEEVPFEAGFVWLDKPFLMTDRWGRVTASRAVSWSTQAIEYPGRPKKNWLGQPDGTYPPTQGSGVRMTCWHYGPDIDGYTGARDESPPAGLIVGHTMLLPIGQRYGGRREGEHDDFVPDDFAHWMHVLWCFMEMEIVTHREAPLTRPAIRRARGLKRPPKSVNVITLRKSVVTHGGDEGEQQHRPVDWSCQWVVQGHHRHLESYAGEHQKHHAVPDAIDRGACAVCGRRITWVKAHVRGPDWLPLRSPGQLYRLER